DIFSFSNELPYRIDFFGDEVETIRTFHVETQLSESSQTQINIVPTLYNKEKEGISFLRFLPDKTLLGFRDFLWVKERVAGVYSEASAPFVPAAEERTIDLSDKVISGDDFLSDVLNFRRVEIAHKTSAVAQAVIEYQTSSQPGFRKNFDLVSEAFHTMLQDGYTLYILSDSRKQTDRIHDIFRDRGEEVPFQPVKGTLHEGFYDKELLYCYYTDHQLFDRFHKYSLKSENARIGKIALSLKELNQFQEGDYVVHTDHGIGKFCGLIRTDTNGKMQEFVKLTFKDDDILCVSIHALHRLSKYKGKDGEPPRISKLGTGAWERMKERTKSRVKDIARDLIKLYSQRKEEKGFAYSPDSFMQQELEASFIYEDTPDQSKATADIKADMESDVPMDRLICGDVGFGKTEVSVRAAFKAVSDNKQVAVLVPTTVLALQHYKTFTDRLKDFPCKVDYISRARTATQIKQIKQELKEGSLDILIGTHRLIGKDIEFKDLGLLIIDEEQKFGVSIKEKLRQMKVNVDTMTMSATPIPRTLQFSMMGARDLSVITTPPPNRYPIQTELHTFNEELIADAINFELSRNGQILFVHNRVQNIYEVQRLIQRLVPDARIQVGHGQLEPEKLEHLLVDFINQDFDILIATTIIESGIDIPNANTIFINNAQNFGLSDLHQLRGRVGRSNRRAFCYLLAPPVNTLSDDARRRLQAIENFSELGSGIHIAMQDLDIRGAGNMLGAEQSGFIADIGYETYQKILQEAVSEIKSELYAEVEEPETTTVPSNERFMTRECVIESDLELFFPESYIPSSSERIMLYRELDTMDAEKDITAFELRLHDRFGKIPEEGRGLISLVLLRVYARQLGLEKVVLKMGKMYLYFFSDADFGYFHSDLFGRILAYTQSHPRQCRLQEKNGKRSLLFSSIDTVDTATRILREMLSLSI
ncbi:MAG: transcription-repair coupling factor, partial [Bacteroidales bacterium]|nr:transcription-repair coupling factor [Bacteroidales bacterium]